MKVLVTGATGYIGAVAADVLAAKGHQVLGLARSNRSASALRERGIQPTMGDFGDPASLTAAIRESRPEAVVSTASLGASSGDNATTFARDRDAVHAMREGLADYGGTLVFTSGSAVFGTFNNGAATDAVYAEDSPLPLPRSVFAPPSSGVHPLLVAGFGDSMAARVQTEQAVLADGAVHGVVVRPGLVYGRGGNSDITGLITRARGAGRAGHWGSGDTLQSYVHVDDLAELYALAVEHAPPAVILHGAVADVSQHDLAAAVNRMIGAGEQTDDLTLEQMLGMNAFARIGLALTRGLSLETSRKIGQSFTPPPTAGSGISLSLNKRLSSRKTRELLAWRPTRTDILHDIEFGSYAD